MGSLVADIVTGRTIFYGEPVVVFMLGEEVSEPKSPRKAGILPADAFSLQSLPVHGNYETHSELADVDMSSLAAKLCLQSVEARNWEEFDRKNKHFIGMMHKSTYDELVRMGPHANYRELVTGPSKMPADREQVLAQKAADLKVVGKFVDFTLKNGTSESLANMSSTERVDFYMNQRRVLDALLLRVDTVQADEVMELVGLSGSKMPQVLRAQNITYGHELKGPLLDMLAAKGLHDYGVLDFLAKGGEPAREMYLDLVGQRWELQRLVQAMERLGAAFRPSVFQAEDENTYEFLAWQEFVLKAAHAREVESLQGNHSSAGAPFVAALRKHAQSLRQMAEDIEQGLAGHA